MDTVNDPLVEETVAMMPTQVGKTECGNNIVGYFIDQDPCGILYVMPTLDLARTWSMDRFAPMLRDTPCLRDKVADEKTRTSENAILRKKFPGGHIAMAGANSPASLASRPIRVLIFDEVDLYKSSAGAAGSPLSLGKKRQQTFWNRKTFYWSTPLDKLSSRIEPLYEQSDKRKFWIPCPKCSMPQILSWDQVKFINHNPDSAYYLCQNKKCNLHWTDGDKNKALKLGKWKAENPFSGIAGFWMNGLYSPFLKWRQMVKDAIKAETDVEEKKVWTNTFKCETWEEAGLTIEPREMAEKREPYGNKVPRGVLILTAGVDVQEDRIEVEVMGWGMGEETWGFRYIQLMGSPSVRVGTGVLKMLDDFLKVDYEHELGIKMHVAWACVDTGFYTQQVYNYCRGREPLLYPVKGSSTHGKPIINRSKKKQKSGVQLLILGTDTAKTLIYRRIMVEKGLPGKSWPEFMHFPQDPAFGYDEEYFKQLTAEKAIKKKKGGIVVREWVKIRQRNEALDNRVYAMAAFYTHHPKLEDYQAMINKMAQDAEKKKPNSTVETKPIQAPARPQAHRTNWVNKGWKGR